MLIKLLILYFILGAIPTAIIFYFAKNIEEIILEDEEISPDKLVLYTYLLEMKQAFEIVKEFNEEHNKNNVLYILFIIIISIVTIPIICINIIIKSIFKRLTKKK